MDPIIKEYFMLFKKNLKKGLPDFDYDLFLADIYSLGITFLETLTNLESIRNINES